ncbi:MAG: UDP-N-acetyl glucosamine 2-epimerase, partial [Flavobacteriales bacterium]
INRIVTDSISTYFFTTTPEAGQNLIGEGVDENKIFWVGNTMIDTLLQNRLRFYAPKVYNELCLSENPYIIVTLHRPSNVDFAESLIPILQVIEHNAAGIKFIFPAHPRTARILNELNFIGQSIHIIEPLSYLEFNFLVMHAAGVITDSGGITEETTVLNIPCITLRDNTERPETCMLGTNVLVGSDMQKFTDFLQRMVNGQWHKGQIPELWDGKTSERIVQELRKFSLK